VTSPGRAGLHDRCACNAPAVTTRTSEIELIAEARAAVRTGQGAAIRRALDLKQADIARACEVDCASVSRWEAGTRLPGASAAVRYGLVLRRLHEMDAARGAAPHGTSPADPDPAPRSATSGM
jgi:DNA-binding transcriptional regulator YiaG